MRGAPRLAEDDPVASVHAQPIGGARTAGDGSVPTVNLVVTGLVLLIAGSIFVGTLNLNRGRR